MNNPKLSGALEDPETMKILQELSIDFERTKEKYKDHPKFKDVLSELEMETTADPYLRREWVLYKCKTLAETKKVAKRSWKVLNKEIEDTITVSSYNVLASYKADHAWFNYSQPEVLDFAYRGPRIIQELKESDSDIIAL
jgi:hypothetical protein